MKDCRRKQARTLDGIWGAVQLSAGSRRKSVDLDFGPVAYQPANRTLDASELIAGVADWSQRDARVVAAGVCGSHARGQARSDSDIDFCILTADPASFLEGGSWITGFGSDARVSDT